MQGYNSIELIGNVGSDPELKEVGANGMQLVTFSIATNRIGKSEVTDWHRCKAFGKTAEVIAKYVVKGSALHVNGTVQYGSYTKEGTKVYTTDIVVNRFTLLSFGEAGSPVVEKKAEPEPDDDLPF